MQEISLKGKGGALLCRVDFCLDCRVLQSSNMNAGNQLRGKGGGGHYCVEQTYVCLDCIEIYNTVI